MGWNNVPESSKSVEVALILLATVSVLDWGLKTNNFFLFTSELVTKSTSNLMNHVTGPCLKASTTSPHAFGVSEFKSQIFYFF